MKNLLNLCSIETRILYYKNTIQALKKKLILLSFLFFSITTIAQSYSSDELFIFNGKKYQYSLYNIRHGQPFLESVIFKDASIYYQGRKVDCKLNYDIHLQKVIVQAITKNHTQYMIEIPPEFVDSFSIQSRTFIRTSINGHYKFPEKIGNENKYILLEYHKLKSLEQELGRSVYYYSQVQKKIIYHNGNQEISIKNKRALFRLLSTQNQQKVKQYFKKNHIKFKNLKWNDWAVIFPLINSQR